MCASFNSNFQCVTVASAELIQLPLRDILASRIKPADLLNKIKSCSSLKNKLRQDQLKICFLQPPDEPDYNKFDVTLLYTLIRNLCTLPSPSQGWGNEPKSTDTQLSDDIERLRLFRNNYFAHVNSAEISDALFDDIWMNLKDVLKRIQSQMNCNVDYEQKLLKIERYKITENQLDTCKLLLDAYVNLQTLTCDRDDPVVFIKGEDEVMCGDAARFEADVKTAEVSQWSITWQRRKGDTINCIDTNKKEYRGSTNRILVIKSACKDDEGEYQVVLSRESNGPDYKSRNSIRLHVLGERPILSDLKVTTKNDGIIIQCSYELSSQSPEVNCIEWKKNGQPLDQKTMRYIGGSVGDKYLTIASPTYEDRGKYSCTVTNAVGSMSKSVMLDVPTVKLSIDSTFRFGSRAIVNAEISAMPLPERAKWQKSNDRINFYCINITKPKYDGSIDISERPVLVVSNISFDDKLHYRLLVSNKIGDGISGTVYFNVTGSCPNITTSEHTNIKERSIALVGNIFVYDDSPDIIDWFWTKNGKIVDSEECDGNFCKPTLTIRNVSYEDAGQYQLTATNAIGSTTSDAIVLGKPDVFFERPMMKTDGSQWFPVTIQATPAPFSVLWSIKISDDDRFKSIDIKACEYKGTTNSFPRPVLVVNQKEQLENNTYRIEVENFIGKTVKKIPDITIYKKRNVGIRFVKLSNYLANNFPMEKLLDLKYILRASGKVTDVNSLKAADTVLKCFVVLQDENLFTPNNVIFMQFLFKEMHCKELYEKCIQYAQEQEALCFFEKPPDNGYKNVKFHIKGDLNNYSKQQIENIIDEVAAMLDCEEGDILESGVKESSSFMLVLSIKKTYMHKLFTLGKQDCLNLRKLNIDYFIVDKETIILDSENGIAGEKPCKERKDTGLEFAKLSYILANQFPKEKFQNLKDVILASGEVDALDLIKTADSALKCFSILQEEHLFTEKYFSFMQFLCKETSCDKLFTKCIQFALETAQEESTIVKHDQEVLVHSKDCGRHSIENKTGISKIQRTSLVRAISQKIKSNTSTSCKEYKNINTEQTYNKSKDHDKELRCKEESPSRSTIDQKNSDPLKDERPVYADGEVLEYGFIEIDFFVRERSAKINKKHILEINKSISTLVKCTSDDITVKRQYKLGLNYSVVAISLKRIYLRKLLAMEEWNKHELIKLGMESFRVQYITVFLNLLKETKDGKVKQTAEGLIQMLLKHQRMSFSDKTLDTHPDNSSPELEKKVNVPYCVYHISCLTSTKMWVSCYDGLFEIDETGKKFKKLETDKTLIGSHSVSIKGDILFLGPLGISMLTSRGIIKRVCIRPHFMTCIHASKTTGDILLGYQNVVIKYDRHGKKIKEIILDDKGQPLYGEVNYITDNMNGDILVSDNEKKAVVSVNNLGCHRFDYPGNDSQSQFIPRGICTDAQGHVLVCNTSHNDPSVHLLNEDGQYLMHLLTKEKHNLLTPTALCVDENGVLYVGDNNTILVFTYLSKKRFKRGSLTTAYIKDSTVKHIL